MSVYPYGICSDQHAHSWSAFSTVNPDGVNSRLQIILDELWRCAQEVKVAGGDTLYFAGDLFHVRGKIDPEVFNPTYKMIELISTNLGIEIIAIPGNHDLKGRETTTLGNAMQTLGALPRFRVITASDLVAPYVAMIPWQSRVEGVREEAEKLSRTFGGVANTDLIIHAPTAGAIAGLDGLDPAEILGWGFKRVFAGHYHNHKGLVQRVENGEIVQEVYSIGATAHQTWSDVGTKAGFLIVHEDRVDFRASHAPSFIEINASTPEEDIPLIVDGAYVRVRYDSLTEQEVKVWREELLKMGALGVLINAAKETTVSRTGATVAAGASLETSVSDYVARQAHPRERELNALCQEILTEAKATAA